MGYTSFVAFVIAVCVSSIKHFLTSMLAVIHPLILLLLLLLYLELSANQEAWLSLQESKLKIFTFFGRRISERERERASEIDLTSVKRYNGSRRWKHHQVVARGMLRSVSVWSSTRSRRRRRRTPNRCTCTLNRRRLTARKTWLADQARSFEPTSFS